MNFSPETEIAYPKSKTPGNVNIFFPFYLPPLLLTVSIPWSLFQNETWGLNHMSHNVCIAGNKNWPSMIWIIIECPSHTAKTSAHLWLRDSSFHFLQNTAMDLSTREAISSSHNSPEFTSAKEVPRAGNVGAQEINTEPQTARTVVWLTWEGLGSEHFWRFG